MALRWYSTVVDCRDIAAQARWWGEVLGWKSVYESRDECVLVPQWMSADPVEHGKWDRELPGLVFVPVAETKQVKNRLHIDLAPHLADDRDAEIARLLDMGATRVDVGQSLESSWTVLADPEGNEFCVLSARDR